VHYLEILQQSYSELTMLSKKRLVDLQSLQEFILSVMTELAWLNEKEEIEISRDWSSKLLNLIEIQTYYEVSLFFLFTPAPCYYPKNLKYCYDVLIKFKFVWKCNRN
jgi:hypothetical protein